MVRTWNDKKFKTLNLSNLKVAEKIGTLLPFKLGICQKEPKRYPRKADSADDQSLGIENLVPKMKKAQI